MTTFALDSHLTQRGNVAWNSSCHHGSTFPRASSQAAPWKHDFMLHLTIEKMEPLPSKIMAVLAVQNWELNMMRTSPSTGHKNEAYITRHQKAGVKHRSKDDRDDRDDHDKYLIQGPKNGQFRIEKVPSFNGHLVLQTGIYMPSNTGMITIKIIKPLSIGWSHIWLNWVLPLCIYSKTRPWPTQTRLT